MIAVDALSSETWEVLKFSRGVKSGGLDLMECKRIVFADYVIVLSGTALALSRPVPLLDHQLL